MTAWFLRKLWRRIVPVVASDIRRVIAAAASRLPATAEQLLMSQLDYVVGRPKVLARGFEYQLSPSAPRLAGLEGEFELAVVEMCYYQQIMPFVIRLRDGYLHSVETKPPLPLVRSCDELEILDVRLNPEADRTLCVARANTGGADSKNGQDGYPG